ncbi:MAG: succinate dehydrogenase, cytochrome b556 subunit [Thiobacillus sp.]|nr:succinate dehydrogenase, cytochrome b556 subunit [Thiobacillus sp.]
MKYSPRPVYLDLFRIHLPAGGWVSILHRVSGAALFLGFPFGVWGLSVSLSGEAGFQRLAEWLGHPFSKLLLLLLIWAGVHHLLAGLRHLALDVHWGVARDRARASAMAVLVITGAVTALAAWRLFA